jgi:hypothetical protein
MKRTEVTYGQLDKVLRSLGFSCRPAKHDPPGRIYEHNEAGAVVMLPEFAETDQVFEWRTSDLPIHPFSPPKSKRPGDLFVTSCPSYRQRG